MTPTLQPERQLGNTGVQVPLIGYGTAPLGKPDIAPDHAQKCLNHAIDMGITYLDTSPDYGSEPHVGEVMRKRRNEVFLATKVNKRRKQDALEELKGSLKRLQTDHVDLIQVHSVSTVADLDQALAPDGVLAGLEQARQEGLVRFIGITGHARPDVLAHAISQFTFDTVLSALGIVDHLVSGPDIFLLPAAAEQNLGVIAMKVFSHGNVNDRELALRYTLGLPGVTIAILGMKNTQEIDENVQLASQFSPLTEDEKERLVDEVRPLIEKDSKESKQGKSQLFWLHDTNVMGWQQQDEPAMVEY